LFDLTLRKSLTALDRITFVANSISVAK